MSIAELELVSGAPEYDRTPPADLAAEQAVLGAMLLSKDAIADVVESLKSARLLSTGACDGVRRRSWICTGGASRPTR